MYEAFENESTEDFIQRHATHNDITDLISYLILHRELLRDSELEHLEEEAEKISKKLEDNTRARMLEEIACFKEILALQKKLIEEDDKPRN